MVYLRSQTINVVLCIGISGCRLTQSGLPQAVGSRERWVDGMEGIMIEWIVNSKIVAIWTSDCDLSKSNDLVRGHRVQSPIPERMTELVCSLNPSILVDRVGSRNLLRIGLYNLLTKGRQHTDPGVPCVVTGNSLHTKPCMAYAKLGTKRTHGYNNHPKWSLDSMDDCQQHHPTPCMANREPFRRKRRMGCCPVCLAALPL